MLYANMNPKIFVTNICNKDIIKRRIWCRFRIRWKNIKKVNTKKVRGLRTFVHRTKRWKIHNIYTFMPINFFNGFVISIEFRVFWYPYQNVVRKINVGSYYHFLPNLKPNAYKTAQKTKIFFSNVNKNKLYFSILVSEQQGVKILSP